jgi:ABC-type spermidine/putrescine transport system permease subunit I
MVSETASPGAAPGRKRITGENLAGLALVAAPLLVLVVLVLIPSLTMIASTFHVKTAAGSHLGLDRYAAFFADDYSVENLRYTVVWTLISALTAVVLALGLALYLRFSSGRIATMIHALSLFPLFVPGIIISYALARFLGPNGLFQLLLEQVGITGYVTPYLTPIAPYFAFVWENLPLPVLVISAGLTQVSDHSTEAARDLGAGALRILLEVVLPQITRSLVIAFCLVFIFVVGSFTVPVLLGPPAPEMMGVYIQRTLGELLQPDVAKVQAAILLAVSSIVGGLYLFTMTRDGRGSA